MFSFQHQFFLWLLLAIPILILVYWMSTRRKKVIAKRMGDDRLVKLLIADFSPAKFNFKFVLLLVACIAGIIALANLRSRDSGQATKRSGIDVMFALDVSNSMLAQDVSPSRLERAKQLIGKIMDKLENDRVGMVVFAGKAYLQMPLTADHGAARLYLSSASPDMIPTQGTVISDALKMCNLSFNEKDTKYKAVVLISDGEDHDENAISQSEAMAKTGVSIQTIGIGSPAGATIPDPLTGTVKRDAQGNVIYSKLNEAALLEIAQKGNGSYQLYTGTDPVVKHILSQLNNMEKRDVADDSLYNYSTYFQIFMLLMFLLLVYEIFISERFSTAKKLKPSIVAILFLLPMFSSAQSEEEWIQTGNEAYKKNEFDKAADAYRKAAAIKNAATTADYNLGNALYKKGATDEAIAAYEKVLKISANKMEQSAVLYNKGVVFQNNKKLDECIAAYKSALKINPDDEDARLNLQKALQQKKKQDEQQNKNKEQQKNQQPKEQPSKLSQKEAEQKLQALLQQEKNLHDKLKKGNPSSTNKPEKDW